MMTATMTKRRPGWWYPYIFVGVFGVVLVVNLTMAYFAKSSFTGVQTENAYEKGLAYNQVLAQAARQKLLGWQVDAQVIPHDGNNDQVHDADIVVTFKDKAGVALTGVTAKVELIRPTKEGYDNRFALAEQGEGRYVAVAKLPLAGLWDIHLIAKKGEDDYQLTQRVMIP